jgi:hypothetical protein
MSETLEGLAPWAHPKAQEWIKLILDKSELINAFEEIVTDETRPLNLHEVRVFGMLAALLGHPQIWPENRRANFVRCAMRLHSVARQFQQDDPAFGKSFEPKAAKLIAEDWQVEVEMVRRRGGISKRVIPLKLPHTWKRFWN